MPQSFCDTCKKFTPFGLKRGERLSMIRCKCGGKLKQVSGRLNSEKQTWDYYDRKGEFIISIPIKSENNEQ